MFARARQGESCVCGVCVCVLRRSSAIWYRRVMYAKKDMFERERKKRERARESNTE